MDGIIRQLTEKEMHELMETGEYGYLCEHGAIATDKELIIVWMEEFNEGKPCIVATNALPKSDDGVFVSLPGAEKPPNVKDVFEIRRIKGNKNNENEEDQ